MKGQEEDPTQEDMEQGKQRLEQQALKREEEVVSQGKRWALAAGKD